MKIVAVETFQLLWGEGDTGPRSAFVRIVTDDGLFGLGEASPMEGGVASLVIIARHMAPALIGKDPLDHAILLDTLFHKLIKLGPEGAVTGALAALDIALWDLKGKFLNQPIHKLLGGAWRTSLPCYSSVASLAITNSAVEAPDRLAFELDLLGDFACDVASDDSEANAYTLVEFEDAQPFSIFTRLEAVKTMKRWSPRFERGFSQLVDWAWRMSAKGTTFAAFRHIFGESEPTIHLLAHRGTPYAFRSFNSFALMPPDGSVAARARPAARACPGRVRVVRQGGPGRGLVPTIWETK